MSYEVTLKDIGRSSDNSDRLLSASGRHVIEAVDAEQMRLARQLHAGAQRRQVLAIMALKMARQSLRTDDAAAEALLTEALQHAEQANAELDALEQRRLPWVLTHRGLRAGVQALAARMPLRVTVDISVGALGQALAAHAYVIVAEALTNVVEHSRAHAAEVRAAAAGGMLRIEVHDDGIGGARLNGGSGLRGLEKRVASLRGQLRITSSPGGGTLIVAELPLVRSA